MTSVKRRPCALWHQTTGRLEGLPPRPMPPEHAILVLDCPKRDRSRRRTCARCAPRIRKRAMKGRASSHWTSDARSSTSAGPSNWRTLRSDSSNPPPRNRSQNDRSDAGLRFRRGVRAPGGAPRAGHRAGRRRARCGPVPARHFRGRATPMKTVVARS